MSREKNGQEFKKEFIESSNSKNLYTHTLLTDMKKWQCSSIPFAISVFLFTFVEIATNDSGQLEERLADLDFLHFQSTLRRLFSRLIYIMNLYRCIIDNSRNWILYVSYSVIFVHLKIYRLVGYILKARPTQKRPHWRGNTSV